MIISLLGPFVCSKSKCLRDNSHADDIDWGHYRDTDGTKHSCSLRCSNDDNCEAYEWSDTIGKEKCVWWKKGSCHHNKNDMQDDPKFLSCKKQGIAMINIHRIISEIV